MPSQKQAKHRRRRRRRRRGKGREREREEEGIHMKPNTLCFWGEGQKRRKERNVEQSPLTPPDFVLFAFACFTVLTH